MNVVSCRGDATELVAQLRQHDIRVLNNRGGVRVGKGRRASALNYAVHSLYLRVSDTSDRSVEMHELIVLASDLTPLTTAADRGARAVDAKSFTVLFVADVLDEFFRRYSEILRFHVVDALKAVR
jgi:hypothetical protein